MSFIPIILCGGKGKRLWPISRPDKPKPFLKFGHSLSLLQQTLERCKGPLFSEKPIIVCNENHGFLAKRDADAMDVAVDIILEPESRNSCSALAVAAFHTVQNFESPLLLSLAADHAISDQLGFLTALEHAKSTAEQGYLVTFGIQPSSQNANFGYIKPGSSIQNGATYKVDQFIEKPNLDDAAHLIRDGYIWNTGNFLFSADVFLSELKKHAPEIYYAAESSIAEAIPEQEGIKLRRHHFLKAPELPVDVAVLEKSDRVAVCPVSHDWSDIGTWNGLWETSTKDENGNVGFGDTEILDSQNSIVHSDDKFTALIGLNDVIVVSTKDTVLVARKDATSKIKSFLANIDTKGRTEGLKHPYSERPWGRFEVLDEGEQYKVKRIYVLPGGILSLQKHEHRSEHWTVVQGIATITIGERTSDLYENQHVYVPLGSVHRISNQQSDPLTLIEVQTGSILLEEDIIRLEDNYGRKTISNPSGTQG